MELILVTPGLYPPKEFGFDDPFDLVASINGFVPEVWVRHRSPQGGGAIDYLETARTLFMHVPWDSLRDAAAEVFVQGMVAWLLDTVRRRRQSDGNDPERAAKRPAYMFSEDATQAEKVQRLRDVPYTVNLYGPSGRVVSVISMREGDESSTIDRNPKQWPFT